MEEGETISIIGSSGSGKSDIIENGKRLLDQMRLSDRMYGIMGGSRKFTIGR